MPHYFFHTADGVLDPDDTGLELPGIAAARVEAIRYAGASVEDDPGLLDAHQRFCVIVTDEAQQPLFTICVQAMDPAEIHVLGDKPLE